MPNDHKEKYIVQKATRRKRSGDRRETIRERLDDRSGTVPFSHFYHSKPWFDEFRDRSGDCRERSGDCSRNSFFLVISTTKPWFDEFHDQSGDWLWAVGWPVRETFRFSNFCHKTMVWRISWSVRWLVVSGRVTGHRNFVLSFLPLNHGLTNFMIGQVWLWAVGWPVRETFLISHFCHKTMVWRVSWSTRCCLWEKRKCVIDLVYTVYAYLQPTEATW